MAEPILGEPEPRGVAEARDHVVSAEQQPPPSDQAIIGAEPTGLLAEQAPHGPAPDDAPAATGPRADESRGFPRLLIVALGTAALAYCVTFLQDLAGVIGPVFLALNFMIAAHPLHAWLAEHGVHRFIAAAVTGFVVLLVLFSFFYSIGWSITQLVTTLPDYSAQFNELYRGTLDLLAKAGVTESTILDQLQGLSPANVLNLITPVLNNVSGVASLLLVLVTVVFFLAMDSASIDARLDLAQRYHPRFVGSLHAFAYGVRRYWIVSSVFGLIVAVLDVIALMTIGVPLAMVWGVLSFLTNYIPNVGFVIGLVPPALLALLAVGPGAALAVVIAYCVLNFFIQSIIMPRYTGQAVGITATVTFFSLLFWAWALGVLGALLAVPLTLLVKAILVDGDPKARWANALIASDPQTCIAEEDRTVPIIRRPSLSRIPHAQAGRQAAIRALRSGSTAVSSRTPRRPKNGGASPTGSRNRPR